MGQSVIIALPQEWNLKHIRECLESHFQAEQLNVTLFEDQLDISIAETAWARLSEMPDIDPSTGYDNKNDFISDETIDQRFRTELEHLKLFMINFNDIGLARTILLYISREILENNSTAWIDTDYGRVISTGSFLVEVDRDPGWDWRTANAT